MTTQPYSDTTQFNTIKLNTELPMYCLTGLLNITVEGVIVLILVARSILATQLP